MAQCVVAPLLPPSEIKVVMQFFIVEGLREASFYLTIVYFSFNSLISVLPWYVLL